MRESRLVKLKAMPVCLTFLTVLMMISSSRSAQPAPQAQRQQAVCSLQLRGASHPETLDATVTFAQLHCTSTSPVSIGVNSTYLGKHMSQFTGVQIIRDLSCQQQAQGWSQSSGGTRMSLLALLYFCGDYDITLLQPKVLNMALKQKSSDWSSAVLAFGGSVVATVRKGSFVGNSAGSTIVVFQRATLQVENQSVFDHNSGWTGTGIKATDKANLVVDDVIFSYNTATWGGGALGCHWNASVSIASCLFHNNAASKMGGAVEISCMSDQQATVRHTIFLSNSAELGGAAFVDANISTENSSFTGNQASVGGGAVALQSSSAFTASECTFDKNNASYGGGGLVCYECSLQASRLSFIRNHAVNYGGGLWAMGQAQATISNTTFQGNSADSGGAAFLDANTTISIENSDFTANQVSNSGGGIYTRSAVTATECTFDMNNASYGGGLTCDGCQIQAGRLSFTHNNAVNSGGGLDAFNEAQATISNTTFQGNSAHSGGAAFLDANTTISIENSDFTANHVSNSGGGIYIRSAVTAIECTFDMNNASYGGGLTCDGCQIQAGRLSFTHNNAVNNGGGLDAFNEAQATISNTTFQGNSADSGGAAFLDANTTISIENSDFTANQVSNSGGGIYTKSAVTATECTFDMNNASYGGGLTCDGCQIQAGRLSFTHNNAVNNGGGLDAFNEAQATISNTTFQGNSADFGGAAYLDANTTISIELSSFTANHVSSSGDSCGGGIYTKSAVIATGCTFDMNNASWGGGIYCDGCLLQAGRLSFTHNRAVNIGGGLNAVNQAQVVMAESNISSCTADYGGAVSLIDQATLHVSGSSFWNNTADNGGGAVDAEGQTRSSIQNSTFHGNYAGGYGAAVRMEDSAQVVSHNSIFVDNSAIWAGGAISVSLNANLALSNSSLLNNSADFGGALYLEYTSVALVTAGSIISGNHAAGVGGGGIAAAGNSRVTINGDTKVHGNSAADSGGGVFATDSAQVIMNRTSLSGNQAVAQGGGLYLDQNAHGNFTGSKVMLNMAGGDGGGLVSGSQSVLALQDCLVADNRANGNGGGILLQDTAQLMLLGDTYVTGNHADFGWGGGVSLSSNGFDLGQVTRAVHSNAGQYAVNLQSDVTRLAIVGNTSIFHFANHIGTDEGLLHVVLKTSGYYALPCQEVQVQAVLQDGTFLGSNVSDENGLVHLGFKVARPQGVYFISLSSPEYPDVPAANLTLQIRGCIRGEVTPSPVGCQPCQQGFFSFDPSQQVCSACPGNANCSGGDVITPLPGYWRSSTDCVQIHRCPNPSACNPAGHSAPLACAANHACGTSTTYKDLQCAPGYYGNVCGLCLPGTGATRIFVCKGCMRSGYIIALYILAALVLLCLIELMCHLNRNQDKTADHGDDQQSKVPAAQLLRPLLLFSQYMLVVSSMPVEWPASMAYPLKVLAWVWSPASPETLSIDCLLPRSTHLPVSIQKVLFYVCTPLVILGLLLLAEMAQVQYLRVQKKDVAMQVKDLLHSSALVAVFFFYPSILRNLFSMFACIPLDQPAAAPYTPAAVGSYWVMDMNQQCFTGYHRAWSLGFGLPCILLVCLGLPLGVLLLMSNKKAYLDQPTTRQHYGFLYMSYRRPMFCWECVVMTQTMVLVAISVFGVNLGVIYQVIVMNAALTLMVILLLIFKPYAYQQAGKVMLQAVFCLLLTSYAALTFLQLGSLQPSPEYGLIMGCVVLLVNLVYVVSVVWLMIRLVDWKQWWVTAKCICAKVICTHGCFSSLAVLGVGRCAKQQDQIAMTLLSQQSANPAAANTV